MYADYIRLPAYPVDCTNGESNMFSTHLGGHSHLWAHIVTILLGMANHIYTWWYNIGTI